jgi:hypothetical protein
MIPRAGRAFPLTLATTLPEAAVTIATAFNREGIAALLTGRAAAAIHTRDRRKCRHLNYALTPPVSQSRLASALRHLGFDDSPSAGSRAHADAGFSLELTDNPVELGTGEPVVGQTLQLKNGFVRVLSPTDCCREWLLQWRTTRAERDMNEAVDIAARCTVNMPVMRAWMRKEQIFAGWTGFKLLVDRARAEPSRLL